MTKNLYQRPVECEESAVQYHDSPAHVRNLQYAVDFLVPENTVVHAAADGVVVDLKSDSAIGGTEKDMEQFGNFIEIQHANEEHSEYEHLKKDGVVVKIGDTIQKGQVIGYTGATGWLAHLGPHLHFMVGKYGQTVDDYQTLKIHWEVNS